MEKGLKQLLEILEGVMGKQDEQQNTATDEDRSENAEILLKKLDPDSDKIPDGFLSVRYIVTFVMPFIKLPDDNVRYLTNAVLDFYDYDWKMISKDVYECRFNASAVDGLITHIFRVDLTVDDCNKIFSYCDELDNNGNYLSDNPVFHYLGINGENDLNYEIDLAEVLYDAFKMLLHVGTSHIAVSNNKIRLFNPIPNGSVVHVNDIIPSVMISKYGKEGNSYPRTFSTRGDEWLVKIIRFIVNIGVNVCNKAINIHGACSVAGLAISSNKAFYSATNECLQDYSMIFGIQSISEESREHKMLILDLVKDGKIL